MKLAFYGFFIAFFQKILFLLFKDEMYNTMNSCHKYTSIPKSSFYKINILILPINTGEKYPKHFIHFAYILDYQPL